MIDVNKVTEWDVMNLFDKLIVGDVTVSERTDAALLLRHLFYENKGGPQGFASWKDAAVNERIRRAKAESKVEMQREELLELERKLKEEKQPNTKDNK